MMVHLLASSVVTPSVVAAVAGAAARRAAPRAGAQIPNFRIQLSPIRWSRSRALRKGGPPCYRLNEACIPASGYVRNRPSASANTLLTLVNRRNRREGAHPTGGGSRIGQCRPISRHNVPGYVVRPSDAEEFHLSLMSPPCENRTLHWTRQTGRESSAPISRATGDNVEFRLRQSITKATALKDA